MKKFLSVILIFISCAAYAGDIVPKDQSCPDGGYRANNGWLCCKDGFAYISGDYSSIQAQDCGCPYGGKPDRNFCCKDGYAFDEKSKMYPEGSGKYDRIEPRFCCPFGGERVSTGECCKNHYEFNVETQKYDLINGHCGCPDGATPASREWAGSLHCCKDGLALGSSGYAHKSNFKHVWVELCGCPQNGVPIVHEKDYYASECCTPDHLYRWSSETNSYSDWAPTLCGCPDGGILKVQRDFIGSVSACCKGSLALEQKTKKYTGSSIACLSDEQVK